MLSPEERNLLENAKALISEIESMQEGEETMEEEEIEMQNNEDEEYEMEKMEGKEEEEYKGMKKGMKAGVKKQESDGTTASDTADERIEDLPEQTEENVDEVAKSIVKLLQKAPVNKSVGSTNRSKVRQGNNTPVLVAMTALTKVVKSLADNQNQQDMALSSILEGLGVAEAVKPKRVEKAQPVVNADLANVLMEVNKSLKQLNTGQSITAQPEQVQDRTSVRKALKGALPQLLTQ